MLCCDYNKNCCLFELVCLLVLSEGGEKNLQVVPPDCA